MRRIEKIVCINCLGRMGLINDENNQQIEFHLDESNRIFKIKDKVEFDITLTNYGLTAINVVSAG